MLSGLLGQQVTEAFAVASAEVAVSSQQRRSLTGVRELPIVPDSSVFGVVAVTAWPHQVRVARVTDCGARAVLVAAADQARCGTRLSQARVPRLRCQCDNPSGLPGGRMAGSRFSTRSLGTADTRCPPGAQMVS